MAEPALVRDIVSDQSAETTPRLRFITATSLFDGHDAAINIIRRILQSQGAEVIHLGHNRAVREIVIAAIQEDVHGIAVSSYQGGHMEYYKYLIDLLKEQNASSIKVFGGGGGVILADEIVELQRYGVTRIYSPEDGQRMGLQGMVSDMIRLCAKTKSYRNDVDVDAVCNGQWSTLGRFLTHIESTGLTSKEHERLTTRAHHQKNHVPVLGITGTGGAGKSSLTDELIRRFRLDFDDTLNIAILAVDPSRKVSGGALLGDRIRMNAIDSPNIFMRSLATRDSLTEIPKALADFILALVASNFDLVIVETPGIGQGDAGIVQLVDATLYVMTSDFGSAMQLEKVEMLDFADVVTINKFDRRGSEDALRDVQKQMQRNREAFSASLSDMPVYGTIASHMTDDGMTGLYHGLRNILANKGLKKHSAKLPDVSVKASTNKVGIIPIARQYYLAEIAETIRNYRQYAEQQSEVARELQQLMETKSKLGDSDWAQLDELIGKSQQKLNTDSKNLLTQWLQTLERYREQEIETSYRNQPIRIPLWYTSVSGTKIPIVAFPQYHDQGDILKWLMLENLPGFFPYTAGVFPFKRQDEDPTRMFAGEGDPSRTNRRFKFLSAQSEATRLSTAFDSVTLYGCDPDNEPDVLGRIGNSGVSIATLDDMKALYDGFDFCDPKTSVSMTINGPAPTILAMFFNAAIDQQVARVEKQKNRTVTKEEYATIKEVTLKTIRGTVQADILKEDQGQNTCIFSTEFSLKLMGDVQEYFIQNNINHFYSASVSGYHIAEAGANPLTQLAFTLANGFTYIEAFLARGMAIDDFAPNLSFFFSNGMEPEYSVIGRVARRIWAIALGHHYHASERSQKLKYHIQTSGRSLHAGTLDFNDIRTTLQALIAVYDNCNSLHTNASDEAVTTPSEETVRHAMAIQMIINREWGLAKNENPNQGAFIIEQLTDLVEQAVLQELERISERGGVLGAMETGYQRSKIQTESMNYETAKHNGSLPIVGVNLFHNPNDKSNKQIQLSRSTETEKQNQIQRLREFKQRYKKQSGPALDRLKQAAMRNENVFSELMETVRFCTLGQITEVLFQVGGRYRRNM